jgi:hypothetical protein
MRAAVSGHAEDVLPVPGTRINGDRALAPFIKNNKKNQLFLYTLQAAKILKKYSV